MYDTEDKMVRKGGCTNTYKRREKCIKLNTKAKTFKYIKILLDTIGNGS